MAAQRRTAGFQPAEQEGRQDAGAAIAPLVASLDVGVSKTVCLASRRDPVLDMHPERPLRVLGP